MNIRTYVYLCIWHVPCACCFNTYFLLDLVETELPFASSALPSPIPHNSSRSVGHQLDARTAIIEGRVGFCILYSILYMCGCTITLVHTCTHTQKNTHTCIQMHTQCTYIHRHTLTHRYVLYAHTVCTPYIHICTQYTHKHPVGSSTIQDSDGVKSNASNFMYVTVGPALTHGEE